jgi:hypothetical protein
VDYITSPSLINVMVSIDKEMSMFIENGHLVLNVCIYLGISTIGTDFSISPRRYILT